ncbi:hypothetical protein [Variovorax rhizosphaerae]|uniref:Uncharacterized protein n=1 Tax=Variovorax rhizosphaerae TaxID=1836200 RepID=A0ABU8WSE8_9BURK
MTAKYYNPDKSPVASEWLALSESERIRLVQRYHTSARINMPNAKAHAAFHAIVENQIAMGFGPSCHAVERLQVEGLSRHEAIHAIGSIVARHAYELLNAKHADSDAAQRHLHEAIDALTARTWRASGNGGGDDG